MAGSACRPISTSSSTRTSTTNGSARWRSSASSRACCRPMPATHDALNQSRRESVAPVLAQDREQEVALPLAVDQQIIARIAFLLEAGAQQQRAARHVARQAGGLDPVQTQPLESEIEGQRQRG